MGATLSLSGGTREPKLQLQPERRVSRRWPRCEAATALRIAGPHFGLIHDLAISDYNDEGMGAYCDDAIEPGAIVTIGFATQGRLARRAVAVHCQPIGDGYRVGFRFEHQLAA